MRSMLITLGLIIGFSSMDAKAVREIGNGGDAIVCKDPSGQITSVLFYDYFEAENIRRIFHIDFGGPQTSYEGYLQVLFRRLEKINPHRAEIYRNWYNSFFSDAEFLRGIELVDIPDTGDGYVPAGCELKQLAVQREPRFPNEFRYTFNLDLFEKLSEQDKAGIIFHELILREVRGFVTPHLDSINARVYNSLVSSKSIESMSLKDYFIWLNTLKVEWADAQKNVPVLTKGATFHNDSTIAKATGASEIFKTFTYQWNGQQFVVINSSDIKFNQAGWMRSLNLDPVVDLLIQNQPFLLKGSVRYLQFEEGDRPRSISGRVEMNLPEVRGTCSQVILDEAGHLKNCTFSQQFELLINGHWTKATNTYSTDVTFDQQLHVVSVEKVTLIGLETTHFKGYCQEAKLDGLKLVGCRVADGRVNMNGVWTYVSSTSLELSSASGAILAGEWNVDLQTSFFQGICQPFRFFENGELQSCGDQSEGKLLFFGSWVDSLGGFERFSNGRFKLVGSLSKVKLEWIKGEIKGFKLDENGFPTEGDFAGSVRWKDPNSGRVIMLSTNSSARSSKVAFYPGTFNLRTAEKLLLPEDEVKQGYLIPCDNLTFYLSSALRSCRGRSLRILIHGEQVSWSSSFNGTIGFRRLENGSLDQLFGDIYYGQLRTPSLQSITDVYKAFFNVDETVRVVQISSIQNFPTPSGPRTFRDGSWLKFDSAGAVVESCSGTTNCSIPESQQSLDY